MENEIRDSDIQYWDREGYEHTDLHVGFFAGQLSNHPLTIFVVRLKSIPLGLIQSDVLSWK